MQRLQPHKKTSSSACIVGMYLGSARSLACWPHRKPEQIESWSGQMVNLDQTDPIRIGIWDVKFFSRRGRKNGGSQPLSWRPPVRSLALPSPVSLQEESGSDTVHQCRL